MTFVRYSPMHVRAHGVVGEVVLDAPAGLEAELLGEPGELQVVAPDIAVAPRLARILEDRHLSDVSPRAPHGLEILG